MPAFYGRPRARRKVSTGIVTGAAALEADAGLTAAGLVLPAGGTILRVGPATMQGLVGIGPGGDTGGLVYRYAELNPHTLSAAALDADLDAAEALDVLLMLVVADTPNSYGANTATGFNQSAYRANLDDVLTSMPRLSAMLNNPARALVYVGDEPQHPKWDDSGGQNTWSPTLFNQCARDCKERWPGCYTFGRVEPERLRDGWRGHAPAVSYDGLDYGWMQYEGPQSRAGLTFTQALAAERVHANAINIGCAASFNLWAGGLMMGAIAGVPLCWDYHNNGASSGVVVGAVPQPGYSSGQQVACADWTAIVGTRSTTIASPAWLHGVADDVFDDPDLPFLGLWTRAGAVASWAVPYQDRADMVAEQDYTVAKCLTRPAYNGLRPRKVYP